MVASIVAKLFVMLDVPFGRVFGDKQGINNSSAIASDFRSRRSVENAVHPNRFWRSPKLKFLLYHQTDEGSGRFMRFHVLDPFIQISKAQFSN